MRLEERLIFRTIRTSIQMRQAETGLSSEYQDTCGTKSPREKSS